MNSSALNGLSYRSYNDSWQMVVLLAIPHFNIIYTNIHFEHWEKFCYPIHHVATISFVSKQFIIFFVLHFSSIHIVCVCVYVYVSVFKVPVEVKKKNVANKWQMSFDDDFEAIDEDGTLCLAYTDSIGIMQPISYFFSVQFFSMSCSHP